MFENDPCGWMATKNMVFQPCHWIVSHNPPDIVEILGWCSWKWSPLLEYGDQKWFLQLDCPPSLGRPYYFWILNFSFDKILPLNFLFALNFLTFPWTLMFFSFHFLDTVPLPNISKHIQHKLVTCLQNYISIVILLSSPSWISYFLKCCNSQSHFSSSFALILGIEFLCKELGIKVIQNNKI